MGAEESIRFIDQFIELIDQRPTGPMASLKMFPLRHARAADVQRPLQDILNVRYDALDPALKRTTIRPAISIDARTNMLLVTASPEHLTEVETLLSSLDVELGESRHPLRMVEVKNILPSQAQRVLEQAVIGSDQQIRNSTTILPSDDAGMLLVRASPEVNTEIDAVLAEIDRDATRGFEVRTITLQRASAEAVADTLRQLYDDRAQMARQGRGQQSRGGTASLHRRRRRQQHAGGSRVGRGLPGHHRPGFPVRLRGRHPHPPVPRLLAAARQSG